jgi:hypothetical protein
MDRRLPPHRLLRQWIGHELRPQNGLLAKATGEAVDQEAELTIRFVLVTGEELTLAIF